MKELRKQLKQNKVSPVYLVVGTDTVARREVLTLLTEHICPGELKEWNLQEMDAVNASTASIIAAATTVPFFGERRLVVVSAFDHLSAEEQMILAEGLPVDQVNVVVLVMATLDRRTRAARALLRRGSLVDVSEPQSEDISAWVQGRARTHGVTLTPAAARCLIDIAGSDTGFLDQEIRKLAAFLGEKGQADEELVRSLAARGQAETGRFTIFRLTEAVAEGQTSQALSFLTELLTAEEPPLRILAMIARQYRLLLLAKAWEREGVAAAAREAGMKQYPMRKLFDQARHLALTDIQAGLETILKTDVAIKTGVDPAGALKMLVVTLSKKKNARR